MNAKAIWGVILLVISVIILIVGAFLTIYAVTLEEGILTGLGAIMQGYGSSSFAEYKTNKIVKGIVVLAVGAIGAFVSTMMIKSKGR